MKETLLFFKVFICASPSQNCFQIAIVIIMHFFPLFFIGHLFIVVVSCQITSHSFLSFIQFFFSCVISCWTLGFRDAAEEQKKKLWEIFICIKLHFYFFIAVSESGRWKIYCRANDWIWLKMFILPEIDDRASASRNNLLRVLLMFDQIQLSQLFKHFFFLLVLVANAKNANFKTAMTSHRTFFF